jgi:hypothetical protein
MNLSTEIGAHAECYTTPVQQHYWSYWHTQLYVDSILKLLPPHFTITIKCCGILVSTHKKETMTDWIYKCMWLMCAVTLPNATTKFQLRISQAHQPTHTFPLRTMFIPPLIGIPSLLYMQQKQLDSARFKPPRVPWGLILCMHLNGIHCACLGNVRQWLFIAVCRIEAILGQLTQNNLKHTHTMTNTDLCKIHFLLVMSHLCSTKYMYHT